MSKKAPKNKSFSADFKKYLELFTSENDSRDELEIVFNRGPNMRLTKFDFNNVIRALKSKNFICTNDKGDYHLNIMNVKNNEETGKAIPLHLEPW